MKSPFKHPVIIQTSRHLQYNTIQVQYNTIQVQYNAIQVQYNAIQYNISTM